MNDGTAAAIAARLPNGTDRIGFVAASLHWMGDNYDNLRVLEALPSTTEPEMALIQAASNLRAHGEIKLRRNLEEVAEQLNLPPEARERIMTEVDSVLAKPQGSEE